MLRLGRQLADAPHEEAIEDTFSASLPISSIANPSCTLNLTMSASGIDPAPVLSLIDLPPDILVEVMDLVSDRSLIINMAVLLTHRRFVEAAAESIARHQHYLIKYRHIVIDARTEDTSDSTQAALASGSNSVITFDKPLMMLVELFKNCFIASYVRSLTYVPPSGNLKHALCRSKTSLELLGQDQKAANAFIEQLTATVESILPNRATTDHLDHWVEALWHQDNGQGINTVLHLLPRLESLSLSGPESRWCAERNIQLGSKEYSYTIAKPTVKKSSLHRISSISKSFLHHIFPHLDELEIDCSHQKIHWYSNDDWLTFLDVPKVNIIGYRQNPVCLAVAIAAADFSKFTRLECTFVYSSHLKDFISKFGGAFACPRLLPPRYSTTEDGDIKMIVEPNPEYTTERTQYIRTREEEALRAYADTHRLNKLGDRVSIEKKLRTLLDAHKKRGPPAQSPQGWWARKSTGGYWG